jgi:hypothetical protein
VNFAAHSNAASGATAATPAYRRMRDNALSSINTSFSWSIRITARSRNGGMLRVDT